MPFASYYVVEMACTCPAHARQVSCSSYKVKQEVNLWETIIVHGCRLCRLRHAFRDYSRIAARLAQFLIVGQLAHWLVGRSDIVQSYIPWCSKTPNANEQRVA